MLEHILVPMAYPLGATFGFSDTEIDPAIEVMGFAIADPETLEDDYDKAVAAFLLSAVPVADPIYKFRKDLLRDINYWWLTGRGEVLHLWGPTGAGKTSVMNEWCARLGVPMFGGKGHRNYEAHEAFGQFVIAAGGEMEWAPGPVTLAAQYGCPVIINEYDRIQSSRAIVFNDVFEGRPFPLPGKQGEVVTPEEGFRVILTTNTNLVEDVSGNYGTANSHDISLLERLCSIEVGYPEREVETALLEDVLSPFDDELLTYWFDQEGMKINIKGTVKEGAAISRSDFIQGLVDVAHKIRGQSKDGGNLDDAALERTMSTRILRRWTYHAAMNFQAVEKFGKSALHFTLKKYLSNLATQSTRIALHQAVEQVFGVAENVGP